MPRPSRLSCSPGAGRLALGPAVPGTDPTATLSSSAPDLNALSLAFQASQLELNPGTRPTFFYGYVASPRIQLHAEFDSTANPPASGTVSTSWKLGNAFVARIDGDATTGSVTPAALYCSSSGSYEISSTAPVTHTVSLEGMSERTTCPGEPLQQPLLARLNGWH